MTTREIAIVGAGPAAASLLERISASASTELGPSSLRIHLIDPHQAGVGRVWRTDNHAALWMNSLAGDVTMFTDDSVTCDGPIRPGPTLHDWAHSIDNQDLHSVVATPDLVDEIRGLTPTTFPSRRVQSVYLDWFHRRVLAELPPHVEVVIHRAVAVDLAETADRQVVHLDSGTILTVDVVVLALGHLDSAPDESGRAFDEFAAEHGLTYVAAGHTAEFDLTPIAPGVDVIALGFGQAFTDLVVLLTEGRGGQFVSDSTAADGVLRYVPSGNEPVIHVGSRRGVPYRSKIDYPAHGGAAPFPVFLDDATVTQLLERPERVDFRRDLLPLVVKEVGWAYYRELFHAHPDRVRMDWEEFSSTYAAADARATTELVSAALVDERDVFDIDRLDSPLAGLRFGSADELHRHVRAHIDDDVRRRTDPAYSGDLAAFNALLQTFGVIGRVVASGRLSPRSHVEDVNGWWFSFFMYYASGPPPARLRQLLALEAAGLVRFIGSGTTVRTNAERGCFTASSSSHPDEVDAPVLVESMIARSSLTRTTDLLLERLRDRGEILEEIVRDDGWQANTGKVVVSGPALNLVDADGIPHPARHGLGSFTSRPAAGAFSRPRTNAPAFRQHDVLARTILQRLGDTEDEEPSAPSAGTERERATVSGR